MAAPRGRGMEDLELSSYPELPTSVVPVLLLMIRAQSGPGTAPGWLLLFSLSKVPSLSVSSAIAPQMLPLGHPSLLLSKI